MLDKKHENFLKAVNDQAFDTVRRDDENWLIALHCMRRGEISFTGSEKKGFLDELQLTKFGIQVLFLDSSIKKKCKKQELKSKLMYWFCKCWDIVNKPIIASTLAAILAALILTFISKSS